jgi:hypothetical protein
MLIEMLTVKAMLMMSQMEMRNILMETGVKAPLLHHGKKLGCTVSML